VELAKRGISVAFSEYEVESEPQLAAALARGLLAHRAGAVLVTSGFVHRGLIRPEPADRLTILGHTTSPTSEAEVWPLVVKNPYKKLSVLGNKLGILLAHLPDQLEGMV
jgi:hypothetical protein